MINRCYVETDRREQLSTVLKRFSHFEKEKEKNNLSVEYYIYTKIANSMIWFQDIDFDENQ